MFNPYKKSTIFPIVLLIFFIFLPVQASAITILQTSNETMGNQAYSGVGVRFYVDHAVIVAELGLYDSGQDGIMALPTAPLSAYLLTSVGGVVSSSTFDSASQGTLDIASKYRFKPITPVLLMPGEYTLAGYGWTLADPLYNCFLTSEIN